MKSSDQTLSEKDVPVPFSLESTTAMFNESSGSLVGSTFGNCNFPPCKQEGSVVDQHPTSQYSENDEGQGMIRPSLTSEASYGDSSTSSSTQDGEPNLCVPNTTRSLQHHGGGATTVLFDLTQLRVEASSNLSRKIDNRFNDDDSDFYSEDSIQLTTKRIKRKTGGRRKSASVPVSMKPSCE
jgi:hypothetical protein